VDRLVADRHSLTVVDVRPTQLTLRQVDERGMEIDRIRITKRAGGQAAVRSRAGDGPTAVR